MTDAAVEHGLPDALVDGEGVRIDSPEAWRSRGRPRLLGLFQRHVYGATPLDRPSCVVVASEQGDAWAGLAVRRQLRLRYTAGHGEAAIDLLAYRPATATAPSPVVFGLNFHGNASVTHDPAVWSRPGLDTKPRGGSASRWPVESMLRRGYAFATVARHQAAFDDPARYHEGLLRVAGERRGGPPVDDEPGAIGGWAWAASLALDRLETTPDLDGTRVTLVGHSRLGKAALWATAQDPRFAAVIVNQAGCGGPALSRRRVGETVAAINARFPHWFCGRFQRYADAEDRLPIDQHQLVALVAPRPIFVASAAEDRWADPVGEFLGLKHAAGVYELLGRPGLGADAPPPVGSTIHGVMTYRLRPGKHGLEEADWPGFLDFVDRHAANR